MECCASTGSSVVDCLEAEAESVGFRKLPLRGSGEVVQHLYIKLNHDAYIWKPLFSKRPSDTPPSRLSLDEFGNPVVVDLENFIGLYLFISRMRMIPTFNALKSSTTVATDECLPKSEVYHLYRR
jgi:hypothetical protein